ncbi:MAG TPA: bifunctional glutamate N-acetyltransferase/amino-acid acetyltransferase ArgJ [Melioribacteraceae bacterium]|nr:bifunctional glutamate N-acetyltransferase/amino-acid acetyltransferase ArgJ [Melioribacteraceae bacterium]
MFKEEILKSTIGMKTKLPSGYKSAGIHCGIKKSRKDLALIVSNYPATAAGVFTLNKVQAAPVLLSKKHLNESENICAIIVNSGNANACTGERGYIDAELMTEQTAEILGIEKNEVLVASTGVIGELLPMEKILNGITAIKNSLADGDDKDAAEAIMTTDTFYKAESSTFDIAGKEVTISGIAKGSGMIHPNMATMLGFITTDAAIEKDLLQTMLKNSVDKTFNRIVVDGDTSTNDMVLMLANGASGVSITRESNSYEAFESELFQILKKLAIDIIRDGEGATKLIEVIVEGAESEQDAVKAAKTIALSPLVKTAIHGEDANWGRIIAAVGYSGIEFDPAKFEIFINDTQILQPNYIVSLPNAVANQTLKVKNVRLKVRLNAGSGSANCWTCDFSEDYVKINGSYRS